MTTTADALDNIKIALDEYARRAECLGEARALLRRAYDLVDDAETILRAAAHREDAMNKPAKMKTTEPQRALMRRAAGDPAGEVSTACGLGTAVQTRTADKLVAAGLLEARGKHRYAITAAGRAHLVGTG